MDFFPKSEPPRNGTYEQKIIHTTSTNFFPHFHFHSEMYRSLELGTVRITSTLQNIGKKAKSTIDTLNTFLGEISVAHYRRQKKQWEEGAYIKYIFQIPAVQVW